MADRKNETPFPGHKPSDHAVQVAPTPKPLTSDTEAHDSAAEIAPVPDVVVEGQEKKSPKALLEELRTAHDSHNQLDREVLLSLLEAIVEGR